MKLFLLIFSLVALSCFGLNYKNEAFIKINNSFYESLFIACDQALEISPYNDDVYFNKQILKITLIDNLNHRLKNVINKYDIYINYYYDDLTECNYACKNVNARLVSRIYLVFEYDEAFNANINSTQISDYI